MTRRLPIFCFKLPTGSDKIPKLQPLYLETRNEAHFSYETFHFIFGNYHGIFVKSWNCYSIARLNGNAAGKRQLLKKQNEEYNGFSLF